MHSYVSPELTQRLRLQQRGLHRELEGLRLAIDRSADPALVLDCMRLLRLFDSHRNLLSALLEALEPDRPGQR